MIVAANRDAGSVSVFGVTYSAGLPTITKTAELAIGGEPWQVAMDACGETAYVVSRSEAKLIEITGLRTSPAIGAAAAVGSEPTAVAITPNNGSLYVANWVEGTVSVVDAATMAVTNTVDLNAAIAATGLLGVGTATRPALAHPRSLAITNNGDASDADESVYVTEFYAQRIAPEAADGSNADVNWEGLLYHVDVATATATTIALPALIDAGFTDTKNQTTGCFPNQLQSVTIDGQFAYVTSICASPRGPIGVFQKGACTSNAQCTSPNTCFGGSCTGSCVTDADCGGGAQAGACDLANGGACKPVTTNIKTTTHPVVHAVDTTTDQVAAAGATNLNKAFRDLYAAAATPDTNARRFPLVTNDIDFAPGSVAYLTANGADAVFRATYDGATGAVTSVGASVQPFVDLGAAAVPAAARGQNPIGIAVAHAQPLAFVLNDVSRNVSAIDLTKQIVAGSDANDSRVATSSALPTDAAALSRNRGKRAFNTGLDRWSLKGQAWGACQTCHFEGLSDNITWYFGRGPRQSTSLDGSFSSTDPNDQRIFNWTAIFDEIPDFENVARSLDGAVGALVSATSDPPVNADRINLTDATLFPPAGAQNLNGSAQEVNDTVSVVKDWDDVRAWIRNIRSPRAPRSLDTTLVAQGATLFAGSAKCAGCHGGPKWTLSQRFYTPSGTTNDALLTTAWDGSALVAAGFPAALLPATSGNQFMRSPNPPTAAADQIQCVLRNVGTYGVSPAAVHVVELRQDMVTAAQGNQTNGNGYNVPSLLGLQIGAPYFHAGNARTLEELLSSTFDAHTKALNASLTLSASEIDALVAYLLSIDENATPVALPTTPGANGGDFCKFP